MIANCDEPPRPFSQALLIVLAPVAAVALIEQAGETFRERMKPTDDKPAPPDPKGNVTP